MSVITFVSHTNKPGGGELALARYLRASSLPVRLVTLQGGGVWVGLDREVVEADGVVGLRRALRGADIVIANSMRAAFITALVAPRRTRLAYWVRDGLNQSAMSRSAIRLTKLVTARRVSHYLANSHWTAQTVTDALNVPAREVDVVYSLCGVEGAVQEARTLGQGPLRLLFLGRLSPWKAPHVAIQALDLLRREGIASSLTIAGGDHFGEQDYGMRLRDLAARHEGVSILGHVDDVSELLAGHDILVHCSLVPEPFGQVIVQGLAAGLPVVATHQGGPLEVLAGSPVSVTYEPGDSSSLAEAVKRVVAHYAVVSRWGLDRAMAFEDQALARATDQVVGGLRAT